VDAVSRRDFFNEAAGAWDEKYGTPELERFLEELVPCFGLKPGQRILDAGTGTGVLIPYLVQAVGSSGSITAIDYAEEMVKICGSKYGHLQNVTIENQNVETLNYPPNFFNAVTCFGLFPHIEDRERALSQFNQVLKGGGRLIIAHALSSAEIKACHRDATLAVANDTLPREEEMRKLLSDTGFVHVCIRDEPGCYFCTSTKS
jgi:ubiquinone/menaquinone biosynthesis C-methylase UbiE